MRRSFLFDETPKFNEGWASSAEDLTIVGQHTYSKSHPKIGTSAVCWKISVAGNEEVATFWSWKQQNMLLVEGKPP